MTDYSASQLKREVGQTKRYAFLSLVFISLIVSVVSNVRHQKEEGGRSLQLQSQSVRRGGLQRPTPSIPDYATSLDCVTCQVNNFDALCLNRGKKVSYCSDWENRSSNKDCIKCNLPDISPLPIPISIPPPPPITPFPYDPTPTPTLAPLYATPTPYVPPPTGTNP